MIKQSSGLTLLIVWHLHILSNTLPILTHKHVCVSEREREDTKVLFHALVQWPIITNVFKLNAFYSGWTILARLLYVVDRFTRNISQISSKHNNPTALKKGKNAWNVVVLDAIIPRKKYRLVSIELFLIKGCWIRIDFALTGELSSLLIST